MHLKKYMVLVILATICYTAMAQKKIFMGISSGTIFQYNSTFNAFYHEYAIRPEYNIGANIGWLIKSKSRIDIELNYENLGIGNNWDYSNTNTSPSTLVKSKRHIDNWGINLSYGYKFLQYKKLDIYASSSLKLAHSTSEREKTTLYNGNVNSSSYLAFSYMHTRVGGAVGLRLKYNYTDHWALTLFPEYTCYFMKFYDVSPNLLQSVRCNLGVDLTF